MYFLGEGDEWTALIHKECLQTNRKDQCCPVPSRSYQETDRRRMCSLLLPFPKHAFWKSVSTFYFLMLSISSSLNLIPKKLAYFLTHPRCFQLFLLPQRQLPTLSALSGTIFPPTDPPVLSWKLPRERYCWVGYSLSLLERIAAWGPMPRLYI